MSSETFRKQTNESTAVDSKRSNIMNSSDNKYTNVTRTSSSSYKPPMSKDPVFKKKIETPQSDSSWYSPFSYIKTMFVGKPVTEIPSSKIVSNAQNKQEALLPNNVKHDKKSNHTGKSTNENKDLDKETQILSLLSDSKADKERSPRFNFNANEVTTKREVKSSELCDEDGDPNAPKYSSIRCVDNKSTYLHTPDKQGTTSFRITTAPKVKSKPLPTILSPTFGGKNGKRVNRKSPVSSRKSSASPRKIPQSDGDAPYPSRLRSKSTPDPSSVKARPVSLSTSQKSLSLKPTSQKVVKQSQRGVIEIDHTLSDVRMSPKLPFHFKPTILDGSKSFSDFRNRKAASHSSGLTSSKTFHLESSVNVIESRSSSNSRRPARDHKVQNSEKRISTPAMQREPPISITKVDTNLIKKHLPSIAISPTFPTPSNNPNSIKDNAAVKKFAISLQRNKEMLKNRLNTSEEKIPDLKSTILSPDTRVSALTIGCSKSGTSIIGNNSSKMKITPRGAFDVSNISPTTAKAPVTSPSPQGVMYMTQQTIQKNQIEKGILFEDRPLRPQSPTNLRRITLKNSDSVVATSPPCKSNSHTLPGDQDCGVKLQTPCELVGHNYIDTKKEDSDLTSPASPNPNALLISPASYNMSNSACSWDQYDMKGLHGVEIREYKIDIFCEDFGAERDMCNSALSGKVVSAENDTIPPPCLLLDNTESNIYESSFEPSLIVQNEKHRMVSSFDQNEFIPFQNPELIGPNEDNPELLMPTSAFYKTVHKKEHLPSSKFPFNTDIKNGNKKVTEVKRRKYPYDIGIHKERASFVEERPKYKTPILKKGIKEISFSKSSPNLNKRSKAAALPNNNASKDQATKRLHQSPYVTSPDHSAKPTGRYLDAVSMVVTPTIQEPTIILDKSRSKQTYMKSPNNSITFNSVASVFGGAIGALASVFQNSLPSLQSPDKQAKVAVSNTTLTPKNTPTKIVERPLSATISYISSFLEDKGYSPIFQEKSSVANNEKKGGEKKTKAKDDKFSHSGSHVGTPSSPVAKPLSRIDSSIKQQSPVNRAAQGEQPIITPLSSKSRIRRQSPIKITVESEQKLSTSNMPPPTELNKRKDKKKASEGKGKDTESNPKMVPNEAKHLQANNDVKNSAKPKDSQSTNKMKVNITKSTVKEIAQKSPKIEVKAKEAKIGSSTPKDMKGSEKLKLETKKPTVNPTTSLFDKNKTNNGKIRAPKPNKKTESTLEKLEASSNLSSKGFSAYNPPNYVSILTQLGEMP